MRCTAPCVCVIALAVRVWYVFYCRNKGLEPLVFLAYNECMKTSQKTVSVLEQKQQETIQTIENLQETIGNQLLTAGAENVEREHAAQFSALSSKKQDALHAISKIEELAEKIQVLKDANLDAKRCAQELQTLADEQYEAFGKALFAEYEEALCEDFDDAYANANNLTLQAETLQAEIDECNAKISAANFFNKLMIQVRLTKINADYARLNAKINHVLALGAKKLVSNDDTFKDKNFSDNVKQCYETARAFFEDQKRKEDALNANAKEEASLKAELISLGATDATGKKRILALKADIKQTEDEIKNLAIIVGTKYANLYCTKEGEEILACTGLCSDLVKKVQEERKALLSLKRRIEIFKLSAAEEEAEKKIASFKNDAEDIKRRIADLQEQGVLIEEKINAALAARDTIVGKRVLLENEEASAQKCLEK